MSKTELESYVESLNLNRTNMKFTYIKWFRKPTASDRFLNFHSSHHHSIKLNIIKNMTERIINTTRNKEQQEIDLNVLRKMFIKSDYSKELIEKTIQKCLQTNINQQNLNELNNNKPKPETKLTLSLPYVKGIEVLKRKLEQIGVKLYFSYPLKLKSLATLNIKPQSKSIIYQMNCKCGAIYNGETKVGLKDRMKQHKTKIKENDINSSSEIVKHHYIKNGQCSFDPNKAFIIDNETNYWKTRKKRSDLLDNK
ncbi:unnamed protein product [Rotaria sp. Silwood1]|nr:unnamed protein product [Rotaria sp. Silwood1]